MRQFGFGKEKNQHCQQYQYWLLKTVFDIQYQLVNTFFIKFQQMVLEIVIPRYLAFVSKERTKCNRLALAKKKINTVSNINTGSLKRFFDIQYWLVNTFFFFIKIQQMVLEIVIPRYLRLSAKKRPKGTVWLWQERKSTLSVTLPQLSELLSTAATILQGKFRKKSKEKKLAPYIIIKFFLL